MVYAEWTPKQGATQYTIVYGDNFTVSTNETFYTITELERAQHYNITVTAFNDSRPNSHVNSITCSGETGKDIGTY